MLEAAALLFSMRGMRFVKFFGPGVCANLGPGPR